MIVSLRMTTNVATSRIAMIARLFARSVAVGLPSVVLSGEVLVAVTEVPFVVLVLRVPASLPWRVEIPTRTRAGTHRRPTLFPTAPPREAVFRDRCHTPPVADQLVVAAVLVDDLAHPTRTLGARRMRPDSLAGRWELPGGKVEAGEDPLAALRRELEEELQITVEVGDELLGPGGPGSAWPLTSGLVMRVWWCAVRTGVPEAGVAHDALAWVDAATINDLAWLDPDLPLVDVIAARLAPPPPLDH
jgi:8-oxo-dGTP diphosphatase